MAGLSLMQTRTFIDRLGDLEEEITKVCRASEIIAKNAGKEHASGVGRLKEACDSLKEKQQFLREAKDCLLGFDGFLHAEAGTMREAMAHPRVGSMFGRIGERMGPLMAMHVNAMIDETIDGIRRVTSSVKALRDAREDANRSGSLKESAKALSKVCSAAEKAIGKAVKMGTEASAPEHGYEHMHAAEPEEEEEEVEMVVEKAAGEVGFHGYSLTAGLPPEFLENAQKKKDEAKGKKDDDKDDDKSDKKAALPPEFLENAQKKKDEAAGKKDDDKDDKDEGKKAHGYDLTAGEMPDFIKEKMKEKDDKDDDDEDEKKAKKKADSLVPGNKSKGPKELGEEDQGWVPGHRTTQAPKDDDEKKGGKKATDGVTINVTVAGGDPSKIAETIATALRQADSKDPDPSMDDDLPGEDSDGEPVVDKSAHGYQLTEPADHGYNLTA